MDISKEPVWGCLRYDFKVGLLAAASSHRICQAFGDSAVNERTARYRFQKFRSRDLSLCDKARKGRPRPLVDEALQAVIEGDSSQKYSELARQVNTSSETVKLHLHLLGKTYRPSKWIPHTLLEVHKQQRVTDCLSLLSRHRSASILNRVLTSDEKWVLYDTPKHSKHWLSPQDTVPHSARPPMNPLKIMLYVWGTYYHLFHSLDNHLRGKSFTNEADVRQALTDFFASPNPEFYRKGIEQLETRWKKVLDVDGDYFEK
ncbi:histone-lysine N-methyltransferase SETMAR [Trichonephila inaurata madagascariensis]|uniref:Histone-lysine N-methyltransferase SETMAR n=1 Tax=Trichonephila inaurata madagascariensis TaxID=2747483 RepID=A0A8X6YJD7_9ARAC|nr:histone-lysine N-methyltransferase SETMAR [Trichonephila inaurata madagascariensis]